MTKAEADALIAQIVAAAEAVEVSIAFLEPRLANALAINVACDLPPPFGLLQVAETLVLGPLHPESIRPLARVEARRRHHVLPAPCWRWQRGATGRVMKTDACLYCGTDGVRIPFPPAASRCVSWELP